MGAHFEALDEGVLIAALKSTGFFSPISISLEVRWTRLFREMKEPSSQGELAPEHIHSQGD